MKIVIASDSFKGSLSSIEVAEAIKQGITEVFPQSEIISFPMADGGEGVLQSLLFSTKANYSSVKVHGSLMENLETSYGISVNGKTAFIEMAKVCGLPLVPVEKRNPMLTTTFGLGEIIKNALDRGCREFIIGIGGSATNDAGLGMLQALGFRFQDKNNQTISGTGGRIMQCVTDIDESDVHPDLYKSSFTIACDVNNPFCGVNGAAYVFAAQKGADKQMIRKLDQGMWSLSRVIYDFTGEDIASFPGTGAAGGIGGAFVAFMKADLVSGIQLLMDKLDFEAKIKDADLIITGEGKADKQTLMGKVPFGILQKAQTNQIPVALIAGSIEDKKELLLAGFKEVCAVTPSVMPLEKAMTPEIARNNIKRTVSDLCKSVFHNKN